MKRLLFLLSLALLIPQPSHAMPISAFLEHPQTEQHVYALGALSMMAFTEGINGHQPRMQCMTDWYVKGQGENQFFAAIRLSPSAFKARFGFDRDGDIGLVELVIMRLGNDACPAK
jgi:hypothetical protein